MSDLRSVHTADLDAATLGAARSLLDDVFAGDVTDHDWGGVDLCTCSDPSLWSGKTTAR